MPPLVVSREARRNKVQVSEGGWEAAASLAGRNRGCGVKDKGDNSDLVRRGWRRRVGGWWTCRASNKYRGRDLNWLSQLLSSHRLSATPPSLPLSLGRVPSFWSGQWGVCHHRFTTEHAIVLDRQEFSFEFEEQNTI